MWRKILPSALALVWALQAAAKGPPAKAAPSHQQLASEASALYDAAKREADPAKADELRRQACEKLSAAYDASKLPDYQFDLGICLKSRGDLPGAEAAFRTFRALSPESHPKRPAAESALEQVLAERRAAAEQQPAALVLKDAVPVEGSKRQTWRTIGITGGAIALLGGVAGVIVHFATKEKGTEFFGPAEF
jgi:hypothetical protein